MYCKNCQHSLSEDAKYCSECGQKVSKSESTQSKINKETSTAFTKPAHAFMLVLSVVAVAILIVVLILDSNQNTNIQKDDISTGTQDISGEIKAQLEKLALDPESVQLNTEMGNVLFDSGRFDEAIPFYQRALIKDSQNISVQIDLAVCFFNLRKIDQAIMEMNKALHIDPSHPKGLFNMGIIYYNVGDFDRVREYWQRLITLHPDLVEAKRAKELLNNLEKN